MRLLVLLAAAAFLAIVVLEQCGRRLAAQTPATPATLTCTLTPNPEAGTYENPLTGEIEPGERWTFSGVECQPLIGADLSMLKNVTGDRVIGGPVKSPLMPTEKIGLLRMAGW